MSLFYSMKKLILISLFISSFTLAQTIEKIHNKDTIHWNGFVVNNNQWGINKIKQGNYNQIIYKNDNKIGWNWEVPVKSYGVLGYPMISIGESTWESLINVASLNYFKNITEIKKFNVLYDTELWTTDGKYNLAVDFWLHDQPKVAFETIAAEVMIWEDYQKFKPFGKKKGRIKTSNGDYTVYVGDLYKKDLKKDWKYIAFVRQQKRTKGQLDLLPFIQYMQNNQLLNGAIYLSSFEFGTEVLNASGKIKIKDYSILIE